MDGKDGISCFSAFLSLPHCQSDRRMAALWVRRRGRKGGLPESREAGGGSSLFTWQIEAGTKEEERGWVAASLLCTPTARFPQVGGMVINYACHVEIKTYSGEQMMLICWEAPKPRISKMPWGREEGAAAVLELMAVRQISSTMHHSRKEKHQLKRKGGDWWGDPLGGSSVQLLWNEWAVALGLERTRELCTDASQAEGYKGRAQRPWTKLVCPGFWGHIGWAHTARFVWIMVCWLRHNWWNMRLMLTHKLWFMIYRGFMH